MLGDTPELQSSRAVYAVVLRRKLRSTRLGDRSPWHTTALESWSNNKTFTLLFRAGIVRIQISVPPVDVFPTMGVEVEFDITRLLYAGVNAKTCERSQKAGRALPAVYW